MKKNKMLIHACCGPCLVGVYEYIENNLSEFSLDNIGNVSVLWYNINIHPKSEYDLRKKTLKQYLKTVGKTPIVIDEYGRRDFEDVVKNIDKLEFSIRCEYCYRKRLEMLFKYASENGYNKVLTTLLISPYQKHDLIISIAKEFEKKYNVEFAYKDFRPLFYEGQRRAKEIGLYRQKYCGCIFSKKEGDEIRAKKQNKK